MNAYSKKIPNEVYLESDTPKAKQLLLEENIV